MGFNYWAKFEDGHSYHVYNRGVNGCNIFYRSYNYAYCLGKWKHYFHPFLKVYAYCLMPNHFHFLVSPDETSIEDFDQKAFAEGKVLVQRVESVRAGRNTFNEFLELQMKDFLGSYSKAINKQQGRTESLFQQRFKRVRIFNEWTLIYKICYIHHNPIHHRFCKRYESWEHYSYRSLAHGDTERIPLAGTLDLVCNLPMSDESMDSLNDQRKMLLKIHQDYQQIPGEIDDLERE